MSCEDFVTLCLMPFLSFSSSWKAHLYMLSTPLPSNPAHPKGSTSRVEYWRLVWVSKTCNFEIKWFIATLGIWCYSNMCCCSTPFGFFFLFFREKHKSPNCWYQPDGLVLCGSLWSQISQHANWFFDTMPLSLFQPPPLSVSILHTFVALWIYSPVIINRF